MVIMPQVFSNKHLSLTIIRLFGRFGVGRWMVGGQESVDEIMAADGKSARSLLVSGTSYFNLARV